MSFDTDTLHIQLSTPIQPSLSPSISPKAQSLLDKALDGETEAIKARVLQLVLDTGINPEEEFFLLCIAFNHLKVMLYEAPQQLTAWSDTLQQTLDAWAASYAQTLELIAQKAEATAALTETASQLATPLTSHTQTCNALMRQLQVSHQAWGESWEQQGSVNADIQQALQALTEKLDQHMGEQARQLAVLSAAVQKMNSPNPLTALGLSPDKGWKQIIFYMTSLSLTIGAVAMSLLAFTYFQDRPAIRQTTQKVDYLLQKQNRRDCLEGVKAADSLECRD